MSKKETEAVSVQGTLRAKTLSLTANQLNEMIEKPELGKLVISQLEASEGNLKGNMAFAIAKAMAKQIKLKM